MEKYTISDFKNDLNRDSRSAFEHVYKVYFPLVKSMVRQNSGSTQDAKDIFQEGMIALVRNVDKGLVKPGTTFRAYLTSICRNLWLNELRRPQFDTLNDTDSNDLYHLDDESIFNLENNIEAAIFEHNFVKLGEDCQQVLKLFFKKESLRQIADIMGYQSENYAKKRKHFCKEKLIELIKEDPAYKAYMKERNS